MPKFFKNKKTGHVITEDQYKEQLLEQTETSSWDMANAGMGLLEDTAVKGDMEDYEEYVPYEEEE